ncbi:XRE family transcriptional regulator [Peribacillus saganii]|uniref:XRE family transcriptional regulator n=1 Tax=Peribacillus saganii TaxID=2303992 RepID=A0A372LKD5_9BACI|nr:helix-turn-helix domain-containing protein [Peribacillus saganii]RFU67109.1 XRE family transcriptional regulator [Peribacillus saganii]
MDFSVIGQKIKELRKQMGLSQGELADGICTQAQISKIEKGDVFPYATTLYLISQRLGVDVNYFFDIGMTPRLDYIQEVENQLRLARHKLDFDTIRQIIKAEEKNPLFTQNKKNYQLLLWHKGIYEYFKNKDLQTALTLIEEALSLTRQSEKIYSERELDVMVSKAVFYVEEKLYEEAYSTYQGALKYLENFPYLTDNTIKLRLIYNFARLLTRLHQYDESISYCNEAIKWCIEHDLLFSLGELHYHTGYNYELKGDYKSASFYLTKSLQVFELQRDDRFVPFIEKKLNQWKSENKISS